MTTTGTNSLVSVDLESVLAASAPCRINNLGRTVTPHATWELTRFFVTNEHVLVYVAKGSGVEAVAAAEIVGFSPHERQRSGNEPFVVETADGERWELTPTGNCGCGSPLRNLNPFHRYGRTTT